MKKHTVLIGITSGIAAYKSLDLIRLLQDAGIHTEVTMTESATRMLPVKDVEHLTGRPVHRTLFEGGFDYRTVLEARKVQHIELADSLSLAIIIPATAHTIARLAHGIADDFLTTTILATTAAVLVCPSMNVHMWHHSSVQNNIDQLKTYGYRVLEPADGNLACGYSGKGRLPDITRIFEEVLSALRASHSLRGKKILVTAGGTIEPIDEVRQIGNKSSGKMGLALARDCMRRGAAVTLLHAQTALSAGHPISEETFETADELWTLMQKHLPANDVVFHAAAVSDFQVSGKKRGKIESDKALDLRLIPRQKLLDRIKTVAPHLFVIGFKGEVTSDEKLMIQKATKRLREAGVDAIVANRVGLPDRGFGADTNEGILILKDGTAKNLPFGSKQQMAAQILDLLSPLWT